MSSPHPSWVEWLLVNEHAVDDLQDLRHTRHYSGSLVFTMRHQALEERLDDGVEANGQRNLPYMRYDHYLAQGWPIGTGVVEGACRHLVKDRMEQAGMRWTKAGAQAVLDLRSVQLSKHWDAYWQFHRQQQHHRLYGSSLATEDTSETQMFQLAA